MGTNCPRRTTSPCPPPGGDYLAEYRAICRDGGERAMLEAIAAKEPPGTPPLSTYPCCSLRVMLVELAGLLPHGEEDGAD